MDDGHRFGSKENWLYYKLTNLLGKIKPKTHMKEKISEKTFKIEKE